MPNRGNTATSMQVFISFCRLLCMIERIVNQNILLSWSKIERQQLSFVFKWYMNNKWPKNILMQSSLRIGSKTLMRKLRNGCLTYSSTHFIFCHCKWHDYHATTITIPITPGFISIGHPGLEQWPIAELSIETSATVQTHFLGDLNKKI